MKFSQSFRNIPDFIFCFILISLLLGCSEDNVTPSYSNPSTDINENIYALNQIFQIPEQDTTRIDDPQNGSDTTFVGNDTTICTTQKYEEAIGFNQQSVLDPTTDVIWPGSIINGASIMNGGYTPITASRGPITFSVYGINIDSVKKTVRIPTLSNIRQATADLLSQVPNGATTAFLNWSISNIYSEDQLKMELQGTYTSGQDYIKGQFDFSTTGKQTKLLFKFIQRYYTLDIDFPQMPGELFASNVTWDNLKNQISENLSPTIVSSIGYGRMALVSVESSHNSDSVRAMLGLSIGGLDVSADLDWHSIYSSVSINGIIIGGSGSSASEVVSDYGSLYSYISQGGNWDINNPGAPLWYKLRYLNDWSIANIVLASEYYIRTCHNIIYDPGPDGQFKITHSGSFEARAGYSYWLDGNFSGDLNTGLVYGVPTDTFNISVPPRAINIFVWVDVNRGDPNNLYRLFTEHFDETTEKCYLVWGAWLSEQWSLTSCSP